MLLAIPLVFLSLRVLHVLFILGELVGILEKAKTWGRHLSAVASPETGRDILLMGIFLLHGKKTPDLFIKKVLVPRSEN